MRRRTFLAVFALSLLPGLAKVPHPRALASPGSEGGGRTINWPQWRGPNRNADLPDFSPPKKWPERLTRNWKITVGQGHSSPVVTGNRVYVQTRQGDHEVIRALDLADGTEIWKQTYPAPYKMHPAATSHGKGPKSTPVVKDGRLFTLSIHGVLSCFDAETGNVNWRKEFASTFPKTSPLYGHAASPIVVDGLCIAHVGGHNKGALTAFEVGTGQVKWSAGDDGPSYASPILVTLADRKQVVTQTQKYVIGVDAANGNILWKIPFRTAYDQNAVTLIQYNDMLVYAGYHQPTAAFRLIKNSDQLVPEEVWKNKSVPMFMSSPVVHGNLIFGMSTKKSGHIFCLNPDTGKILWQGPGRIGDNVALVSAGPVLFLLTTEARLIVIKADDKAYRPLVTYTVADSPTWAHPAILDSTILIKDKTTLASFAIRP